MDRVVLTLFFASAAVPVHAAEPQAPAGKPRAEAVDAELLEFLGSLDTEEEGWQEFLEDRPMRAKVEKPVAEKPAEAKPAPRPAAKPVKVEKP